MSKPKTIIDVSQIANISFHGLNVTLHEEIAKQALAEWVKSKRKGAYGISNLQGVIGNLEVADNFGDVAEALEALKSIYQALLADLEGKDE